MFGPFHTVSSFLFTGPDFFSFFTNTKRNIPKDSACGHRYQYNSVKSHHFLPLFSNCQSLSRISITPDSIASNANGKTAVYKKSMSNATTKNQKKSLSHCNCALVRSVNEEFPECWQHSICECCKYDIWTLAVSSLVA